MPVAHLLPQPPQFPLSEVSFTHAPLHKEFPPGHAHVPPLHVSLAGHALPQVPQFPGFDEVSTHAPLQYEDPPASAAHVHTPAEHDDPPVHAMPQPPQFWLSLVSSTHPPLQSVRPLAHVDAHPAIEQTCPLVQTVVHDPQ